jgi:uncharacterized protein YjbI with pentapeptide repeats
MIKEWTWNSARAADVLPQEWINLQGAYLREANLRGANLRGAYLQGVNLQGANLQGANLDFSCLPLWCGGLEMKIDARIAAQLCYHFCAQYCDDPDYIAARNAVLDFANKMHRDDVPRLERIDS